jgi:hypothetical protein
MRPKKIDASIAVVGSTIKIPIDRTINKAESDITATIVPSIPMTITETPLVKA